MATTKLPICDNPKDFYDAYVNAIHEAATEVNIINKGVVEIPKLLDLGVDTVLGILNDPQVQLLSQQNPVKHTISVFGLVTSFGVIYSKMWKDDINGFLNGKKDPGNNLCEKSINILTNEYKLNDWQIIFLFNELFNIFNQVLSIYEDREDYEIYMLAALTAHYQLGMSIVLAEYR